MTTRRGIFAVIVGVLVASTGIYCSSFGAAGTNPTADGGFDDGGANDGDGNDGGFALDARGDGPCWKIGDPPPLGRPCPGSDTCCIWDDGGSACLPRPTCTKEHARVECTARRDCSGTEACCLEFVNADPASGYSYVLHADCRVEGCGLDQPACRDKSECDGRDCRDVASLVFPPYLLSCQ